MTEEASALCHYFLSYSRSDERIALRLADDLRAGGVAMWVDQQDIRPSEHWDRAIERAVRDCRGLVVVLSPRSVASDNVGDEISFAIDSGKTVLPVMIERCALPLRLTRMQVIDATRNYERALQLCLDELGRRDGTPTTAQPAEPAREPLDPAELALTKERLAPILGPIAGRLVDKTAAEASSIAELYESLSTHIASETERENFLKLGSASRPRPAPKQSTETRHSDIPAEELEAISRLLARHIGPIAPVVVKRESRLASTARELAQQLSPLIPDPSDRAEFLREACP